MWHLIVSGPGLNEMCERESKLSSDVHPPLLFDPPDVSKQLPGVMLPLP